MNIEVHILGFFLQQVSGKRFARRLLARRAVSTFESREEPDKKKSALRGGGCQAQSGLTIFLRAVCWKAWAKPPLSVAPVPEWGRGVFGLGGIDRKHCMASPAYPSRRWARAGGSKAAAGASRIFQTSGGLDDPQRIAVSFGPSKARIRNSGSKWPVRSVLLQPALVSMGHLTYRGSRSRSK